MALPSALIESITGNRNWQVELYKHLHRHPELSLEEHATAERLEHELADLGIPTQRIGGTGVVGIIENGDGPVLAARADTDALPVTEVEKVDYRSEEDGRMHACGHDFHMSSLMGAVRALVENKDAWSGTYIVVFQPAEETAAGAKAMVDDDLVGKTPKPDLVVGQHVMPLPAGQVQIGTGTMFSQGDSLKVTIQGKGSHGSMPHTSVDPVLLASTIVVRLQSIVARIVKPGTFSVVTVGAINAGTKSNIIPDTAELLLNLRHYDPEVREMVMRHIEQIITKECEAAGTPKPPVFEYYDQFPLLVNDEGATARVRAALEDAMDEVVDMPRSTGSEDFPHLPNAWGVPGVYWIIGGFDREQVESGQAPGNHSPSYIPDLDPTLELMTRAQLAVAIDHLGK